MKEQSMRVVSPERMAEAIIAAMRLKNPDKDTLTYCSSDIDSYFFKIADLAERRAEDAGYMYNFSFKPDRHHEDSRDLREALSVLARSGIISIDNPSFRTLRFKLSPKECKMVLKDFALGEIIQKIVEGEQMELFDAA